jgi:hypothetical protein
VSRLSGTKTRDKAKATNKPRPLEAWGAGAAAREEPPYYGALVAINKMPWARRSKDVVDVGTLVGGYEGWLCMRVASSFPAGERSSGRGLLDEREYRDDRTKGRGEES